jgi:hypothetical protein
VGGDGSSFLGYGYVPGMAWRRHASVGLALVVPFGLAQQPAEWASLQPVEGSLLFICNSEIATGELYFKDDYGAVRVLTKTEPKAGANQATWQGDRIVAVIDRDFSNRLEIRTLSMPPTAVGKQLGNGYAPAVSPTGTLAYVRLGETRSGRLVDKVWRRRGARKRVIAQRRTIWDLFWVGRKRLVAFGETRGGHSYLSEVTRHPARTVWLRGKRIAISKQRRVAYSFGGNRSPRVAVMRLDGSRRRVYRSRWVPLDWSPGGRRILVADRSEIGLMSARTGKVRRLGPLPCRFLSSAEWTAPGTHAFPAPR